MKRGKKRGRKAKRELTYGLVPESAPTKAGQPYGSSAFFASGVTICRAAY